jgi:hypothetical protein
MENELKNNIIDEDIFFNMCKYRKCEKKVEGRISSAKYCCDQHRKNEFKFILKERKSIKKDMEGDEDI